MSHAVQSGAGTLRFIGDQVLFCTDIVASVYLTSLDGVVRIITARYDWCRPLDIT
jgi:hypothetical protein